VAKAKAVTSYSILISPSAERDLKRLEKTNKTVFQSIDKSIIALSLEPRPPGIESIGKSAYRKRDGEYRILYQVDDGKRHVIIYRVRDRKDVYKH